MSVWFCIPSARPADEVFNLLTAWWNKGYKWAIWTDSCGTSLCEGVELGNSLGVYPGYAETVNHLAATVLKYDPECDWIVTGGDDTLPDPNRTAEQIAFECGRYFGKVNQQFRMEYIVSMPQIPQPSARNYWSTFGVMQPTGDRFAGGSIDRIAGSPWMGREWCLRANQGKGPLWPEMTHMFVDQVLKATAEKLGVYWMRPDLIHFHKHFTRASDALDSGTVPVRPPAHLMKWNTAEHWREMLAIFNRLAAEDFKSCMPL